MKKFLYDVMQEKNPEELLDYFKGDTYIQYNTGIVGALEK